MSWWRKALFNPKLKEMVKALPSNPTTSPASTKGKRETSPSPATAKAEDLIHLIEADLKHIKDEARELQKYKDRLSLELRKLESRFEELKGQGEEKEKPLREFRKTLMKVKLTIPSKYKTAAEKNEHDKYFSFITEEAERGDKSDKIPELLKSEAFETITEFKDFESRYKELEERTRLCLLCFSIFPQDATIKKRLMLQWWATEGFATNEQEAATIFEQITAKGFIEPVNPNRSPSSGSCRVHPFHHSALVALAKRERLFNFTNRGGPTQDYSGCFQSCLMGEGLISYDDFKRRCDPETGEPGKVIKELIQDLEKLHLLLNVDEHILEFVEDWFSKMKNLNILYLGRWKASATHHIEVEDPKFLKKLGEMKYVKLLSLQGVSNIISLPDSVLQLTNLDILDLRACSNLEGIPERIGFLQSLTHLDMSECYLLAHMPKSLSKLEKLKVLKGFFATDEDSKSFPRDSCTLGDLEGLKSLEKLCIYTDWKPFPAERDVKNLEKLETVTKLTITWGVSRTDEKSAEADEKSAEAASEALPDSKASPAVLEGRLPQKPKPKPKPKKLDFNCFPKAATGDKPAQEPASEGRLPRNLKKLDLKCFPKVPAGDKAAAATPNWLKPKNLKRLEKLYIRGGKFTDLGQYQRIDGEAKEAWTVTKMRLKYLNEIEMEWKQLQELFPKLEYLENVSCPKLTLFPSDAKGVWTKHQ